jgi:hypothetical protein
MRNAYKILSEKYISMLDTEQNPDLTESNDINDQSLYELTHDYLISKNDEALMHHVNRAKNLSHLLQLAFEYTHKHMVNKNLTADNDSVDMEVPQNEVIGELAKKLNKFSEDTMKEDWLINHLHKHLNSMKESGMPSNPENIETGSTQDYPQQMSVEAKKKKVDKKKEEPKKPFAKNPYIAAMGDRYKGLSK